MLSMIATLDVMPSEYTPSSSDKKCVYLWLAEATYLVVKHGLLTSEAAELLRSTTRIEWSTKMSRTFGTAKYTTKEPRIKLSTILWGVASEAERRETVFHEYAHLVHEVRYHLSVERKRPIARESHGRDWCLIMTRVGYEKPRRCHSVSNQEYERSRGRIPLYCACSLDPSYWITPDRAARLKRAFCSKCLHTLAFVPSAQKLQ